jgi:hypothetical protein
MSGLPDLVRRLPLVFYIAAAVMFVWALGNAYVELGMLGDSAGFDESVGAIGGLSKSKSLEYAVREALYMVANGGIIHVLIAIHDKVKGQ